MRQTIKQVQDALDNVRALREGDRRIIDDLIRQLAEQKATTDRFSAQVIELKGERMFLRQLCAELSSAIKIRS